MAFPLEDVRFTTRRGGEQGPTLYPRLLRDRSHLPKVDIAIRYFESMLGCERRELDSEVLVHFFGDHKLARCMVTCLTRSYRYRVRAIHEIVRAAALRRLRRRDIDSPKALRFLLWGRLNDDGDGFLRGAERDATVETIEGELGLRPGELGRLLYLDADEHRILTRVGAEPRPEDVVAQYNFGILQTLLRHAATVELELAEWSPATADAVRELCAANDVDAELSRNDASLRVRLSGRQDALGVWARHGRRLARTVVRLLERAGRTVREGSARVALRDRRAHLRLPPEVLELLRGPSAASTGRDDVGWDDAGWDRALVELTRAPRGTRGVLGLRKLPDPSVWAAGIVVPELTVQSGPRRALACGVRSAAHAAHLVPIARAAGAGEPLLFVGEEAQLEPLRAAGAWAIAPATREPADIARALREALATTEPRAVPRVA